MRVSYGVLIDNKRESLEVKSNRVRIGREQGNDLILNHPSIAPQHAVLQLRANQWEVVALAAGPNFIKVGDRKLRHGEQAILANGQVIEMWPFSLSLDIPDVIVPGADRARSALDEQLSELLRAVHLELLRRMDLAAQGIADREDSDEYHLTLEQNVEDIARSLQIFEPARVALLEHVAGLCIRRQSLEALIVQSGVADSVLLSSQKRSRILSAVPEREQELNLSVRKFSERLGLSKAADLSQQIQRVDQDFWPAWEQLGRGLYLEFKQYLVTRYLKKELKDIVFGYGPLEDLLRIPTITEIMVVDRDRIFIEKNGVLENSGRRFISDDVTLAIIERIVAKVGRRIDKSSPLVDARLTDGSRVNAVIPPLAVSGPCLTVRKFPLRKLTVQDLVKSKSLTQTAATFLQASVLARKNILVSGGTGSGKTTLLNCLSDFIPDKERMVTIEDTAELQLKKQHVVRLETKPANVEGAGAYTIRDLVKNALRMRPDRIIVGECRGPEALDMLQAMNSGHDGSLTTLHANSAEDVVLRLEVLVQMAASLSIASIHRQIAAAVDLVVQLKRLRNGRRVVSQITEFAGLDEEFGGIRTRDLFRWEGDDADAGLVPTGSLPTFMGELIENGMLKIETFYV